MDINNNVTYLFETFYKYEKRYKKYILCSSNFGFLI